MERLARFLSSPIGRKMVMAITGLGLILFLCVHMGGNLLMFVSAKAFNGYSHALVTNPFIYVAEGLLLLGVILHFVPGIILSWKNAEARGPEPYEGKQSAGHTSRRSWASRTMIFSGVVILLFVPFHLYSFKFGSFYKVAGNPQVRDLYRLMIEKFASMEFVLLYTLFMLLIGFHLWHGFGSAFESLGFKYRKGLRRFGNALAVILVVGFLSPPWYVFLQLKG